MTASRVKLSAIVPIHNKATTLGLFFDWLQLGLEGGSLLEVICVLDHCTDDSLSVVRRYAEELGNSRAKILSRNTSPASAACARNLGIDAATGTHCVFLDPDVVGPDDYFEALRSFLVDHPDDVVMCEVLANGASDAVWPFLSTGHTALGTLARPELIEWARRQPALADVRTDLLSPGSSSTSHLAAPWTLAWSSAIIIPRSLVAVTRFSDHFEGKGSEDLELGFRLWSAGATFVLFREALLHLPHPRDRATEEHCDVAHERRMLEMHPTLAMEALCAFDGANANPMLSLLSRINEGMIRFVSQQTVLVAQLRALELPSSVPVLIGTSSPTLQEAFRPRLTICPYSHGPFELPLFGFKLPFDAGSFAAVLLAGVWQLLPERLACRVFAESLRVADAVYLLKDRRLGDVVPDWVSAEVSGHDTPYWARSQQVSTSFHDYVAHPLGETDQLSSFRLSWAARSRNGSTA